MSGTKMETVTLNNGATMPLLGMVYQLHGKVCEYAVQEALELGYRLFDTAQMYQAMRDAHRDEKQGGVPLPPEKNMDNFDFRLSEQELKQIWALDKRKSLFGWYS